MNTSQNQIDVRRVVLDKSFFESRSTYELERVAERGYRFLVTGEFYVEVCTSSKQGLVAKLHSLSEYVDLLDHIGTLYKFEIENRRACSPITSHFIRGDLNPKFSFQFTEKQQAAIAAEYEHIEKWSSDVFEKPAFNQ